MKFIAENLTSCVLFLLLLVTASAGHALDYPHSQSNYYDCANCHNFYSTNPYMMTEWTGGYVMQDDDDTPLNHLCRSCHYDGGPVEAHGTHSYLALGYTSGTSPYGLWQVRCTTCHNPHYQEQFTKYRKTGDEYWIVKLLVDTVTVSATSSTLKAQGAPNWTVDAYKNMKVVPNVNAKYPVAYKITGNDIDTLTIKGQVVGVASGNTFAVIYGKLIRSQIKLDDIMNPMSSTVKTGLKKVKFFRGTGNNSYMDGDNIYDGVCEVCHTNTDYHRNNAGGSHNHNVGTHCTDCHDHRGGFKHGGASGVGCDECHGHDSGYGGVTGGRGTYASHSTHTENDSDDFRGPTVSCGTCHDINNFPNFTDGVSYAAYKSGAEMTTVCNTCHSPGGSYDGVNDPVIGAKANWGQGVYDLTGLKTGKEQWCSGCHDNAPSNSKADGSGVNAATVTGDNSTYGYYTTGHGKSGQVQCTNCHDASRKHIDHQVVALVDVIDSFAVNPTSYRFYPGKGMELPYNGERMDSDFALCYSCHSKAWLSDNATAGPSLETNFRMDANLYGVNGYNLHHRHVYAANSTCIQCHDPHGSTRPAMANEFIAGYRSITYSSATGKYVELTDPAKFSDPASNHGGALTQYPACGGCHGIADLTAGVGPNEAVFDGWYLRLYKPHTYTVNTDYDEDGIPDTIDNCPSTSNPLQTDTDLDGIGDACDNCSAVSNHGQEDKDLDGIGDACDASCDAAAIVWTAQMSGQSTGNEEAYSTAVDANGNVYVTGYTYSDLFGPHIGDNADFFFAKYNSSGVLQWGKHFGTIYRDYAQSIAVDSNGYIYVAGWTNGNLYGINVSGPGTLWGDDYFVAKYDQSGSLVWGRQYSRDATGDSLDRAFALAVDSSGNVYVTGNTSFLKYDSNGNLLKTAAGGSFLDGTGLSVDNVNGFIYRTGGFTYDLQLTKYDLDLNQVWTRSSGTASDESPYGVAVDSSGNIYMTGFTAGSLAGASSGWQDIVIVKYNPSGTLQWTRQIGTSGDDRGIGIGVSGTSLYVSANTSGSFVPYQNYSGANPVLFKYDLNGNKLWHTQWSGIGMITVKGLAVDNTGDSYLPGGNDNGYVLKARQCQ